MVSKHFVFLTVYSKSLYIAIIDYERTCGLWAKQKPLMLTLSEKDFLTWILSPDRFLSTYFVYDVFGDDKNFGFYIVPCVNTIGQEKVPERRIGDLGMEIILSSNDFKILHLKENCIHDLWLMIWFISFLMKFIWKLMCACRNSVTGWRVHTRVRLWIKGSISINKYNWPYILSVPGAFWICAYYLMPDTSL